MKINHRINLINISMLVIMIVHNITKRKRAEEKLLFKQKQLLFIFDSIDEIVYIADPVTYELLYFNDAFRSRFEGNLGDKCYKVLQDETSPCSFCSNKYIFGENLGKTYIWEWENLVDSHWYHCIDRAIRWPDGRMVRYEMAIDITERRRVEEERRKYAEELKRSNEFKDIFTDILRHDLLNPAGIVKGYTELLLDMEEDEKKLQYLLAIERNNQKLVDIIETASRFAKLESVEELEFKKMDIGVIFKEVVENFRSALEEKQLLIEFAAESSYPSKVSPVIEEVFANLLSNAIKYSPKESRIIIDIVDAGEDWKVTVTDFGEGISDDDKPKLFERFKRVKKGVVKGTGLGLAIVKRLTTLHGGTVGVEDNPEGQGSVFWVTVSKT